MSFLFYTKVLTNSNGDSGLSLESGEKASPRQKQEMEEGITLSGMVPGNECGPLGEQMEITTETRELGRTFFLVREELGMSRNES